MDHPSKDLLVEQKTDQKANLLSSLHNRTSMKRTIWRNLPKDNSPVNFGDIALGILAIAFLLFLVLVQ